MVLSGKAAVITGSASGIGRAGAFLFAREGAIVVVADINEQAGRQVAEEIRQGGAEASFVRTDMRSVSAIEMLARATVEKYGRIDIFWHNAGIAGPGGLERMTEEAYEAAMAVHLKAGVFGAKFVIPEMEKAGGGSILFTSSISGLKPSPFSLAYSLAKAGIVMLTRNLSSNFAKNNIRVNCICPGPVETPLLHSIATREGVTPEEIHTRSVQTIPMRRYPTVDEVTQAALFLASDAASAITGVALPVDGGMAAV